MTRFICSTFVLVLAALWECAALAQVVPARYLLAGSLRGEAVQLELTLSPTKATGTLLGTPPRTLSGNQARNGEIRLKGAGLGLTGHLPEPFSDMRDKAQTFSGTLTNGSPFSLELAASYTLRRTEQGPFLQTRTETPFWLVAPWRRLNGQLEHFVTVPVTSFIRDAQQLASAGKLDYPYSYDSILNAVFLTDDMVSLREMSYTYTGGAHPNTGYRSLTFQNVEGVVTRVTLGDLFQKGATYRRVLLGEVTRKLRARRAAWIADGSVELTARDLGVFTLTGRGLEFAFAPYAVGPYAQGAFFVTVPYGQLQELLKPAFLPTS